MPAYDDANIFARILRGELPCHRLLDDEAARGRLGEDWRMVVTDEAGVLLFRFDFIVEAAQGDGPTTD